MRGSLLYKTSIGAASFAVLAGGLLTTVPASAADSTMPIYTNTDSSPVYVWTGAGNTNTFSTAANWKGNSVPTQNDHKLVLPCLTEDKSLNNDLGISYSGVVTTSGDSCKSLKIDELTLSNEAIFQRTDQSKIGSYLTVGSIEGASDKLTLAGVSPNNSKDINTKNVVSYNVGLWSTIKPTESVELYNGARISLGYLADNVSVMAHDGSDISLSGGDKKANSITLDGGSIYAFVKSSGTYDQATDIYTETIEATNSELTGKIKLTKNSQYDIAYNAKLTLSGTIEGKGFALTPSEYSQGDFVNATSIDNSDTKKGAQEFQLTTINLAEECKKAIEAETFRIRRDQVGELTENANCKYGIVSSNGLLKGSGTIKGFYAYDNGVIAPGNSPGKITVLEELSMKKGTTYQAEIFNKDAYDQLIVGQDFKVDEAHKNAVKLDNATLNLSLIDGYVVHKGDTFTIIDNKSTTPVKGTFDGLAEGAEVIVNGAVFKISYTGGDGNDVVLTAQNESISPNAPNTGAKEMATKPMAAIVAAFAAIALFVIVSKRRVASRR